MNLSPHQARFERNAELVRKLVAKRGNCNIPLALVVDDEGDEVKIGRWVGYMRG